MSVGENTNGGVREFLYFIRYPNTPEAFGEGLEGSGDELVLVFDESVPIKHEKVRQKH